MPPALAEARRILRNPPAISTKIALEQPPATIGFLGTEAPAAFVNVTDPALGELAVPSASWLPVARRSQRCCGPSKRCATRVSGSFPQPTRSRARRCITRASSIDAPVLTPRNHFAWRH